LTDYTGRDEIKGKKVVKKGPKIKDLTSKRTEKSALGKVIPHGGAKVHRTQKVAGVNPCTWGRKSGDPCESTEEEAICTVPRLERVVTTWV